MENPLITVVIPAYNVGKTVGKTLDSVINQTYKNLEIIVINDGSTDDTADVVSAYKEKDGRIALYSQKNGGLANVRNVALTKAHGAFVTWVDGDDTANPEWVEKMVCAALDYDADFVQCGFDRIGKNGSNPYIPVSKPTVLDNATAFREISSYGKMNSSVCIKLIKRELFSGVRFPDGHVFEDVATVWKIILKAKKIVCIPYLGINYYMNEGSISHVKSVKNAVDMWSAFHERYEYTLKNRPDLIKIANSYTAHAVWKCWVSRAYDKNGVTDAQKSEYKKMAEFSKSLLRSGERKALTKVEKIKLFITSSPDFMSFFFAKFMHRAFGSNDRNNM